ncbi:hypothetical protein Emed_005819 [Eimeria media]
MAKGIVSKEAIREAELRAEVEGRNIVWWLQQKLRLRWQLNLLIQSQLGDFTIADSKDAEDVNPFLLVSQQTARAVSDFHSAWQSAPANALYLLASPLIRYALSVPGDLWVKSGELSKAF